MVHIWNDPTEVPDDFGPSVVTIGNFDGVHRGHQQVLSQLIRTARLNSARSVAVTFDPHPAQVHRPESAPELIMGLQDKLQALGELGLDAVLVMKYSLELASLTPEEFVGSVLVDSPPRQPRGHRPRRPVWPGQLRGPEHHAANWGRSSASRCWSSANSDPKAFPLHDDGGTDRRCSSTWVREALNEGDVATAAAVLGRPHRMRGEVVHGAARGRALGFPTANLSA